MDKGEHICQSLILGYSLACGLTEILFNQVASFIFLDLPVGTGFSYARTSEARQSDDLQASDHAYQFLRKVIRSLISNFCVIQILKSNFYLQMTFDI